MHNNNRKLVLGIGIAEPFDIPKPNVHGQS